MKAPKKNSVVRRHADATLGFISSYIKANGEAPTMREIADIMGYSRTTAVDVVGVLVENGDVTFTPRAHRGISLAEPKGKRTRP